MNKTAPLLILINDTTTDDSPGEGEFQRWIDHTFQLIQPSKIAHYVNIALVDEAHMQSLNRQFRNKDKPTNVLSFPGQPIPGEGEDDLLGDLALCPSVINQEAKEQNIERSNHWAHITVHGILHLLGYDHELDSEAKTMEAFEVEILSTLGYPNPYQE